MASGCVYGILREKMSEGVVNGTTACLHPASKMDTSASNGETNGCLYPDPASKMNASTSNGEANTHNLSPLPEQVADLSVSSVQSPTACENTHSSPRGLADASVLT